MFRALGRRRPGAAAPSARRARIPTRSVRVLPDLEALSRAAAAVFTLATVAAARRGRPVRIALAGGTTPRRLYEMLADPAGPWRARVPWPALHVFFGDERMVPPDHPDSNYRMARETLLSGAPVPARRVHRIRGEGRDPARAARAYERVLLACFRTRPGVTPRFDLVLLGMGADGHVASLFPGSPVLGEPRRLAAAARPAGGRERVTLTLPVLNAAACVIVLVSGGAKAEAAQRALARARDAREPLPAALVRPRRGRVIWLLDRGAARLLRPRRRVC
jgi:6-phosphogluconolactonase